MPPVSAKSIQISSLPPEEQEPAIAYLERTYGKLGPVTVPEVQPRTGLWCGHPHTAIRTDENDVAYCVECSK